MIYYIAMAIILISFFIRGLKKQRKQKNIKDTIYLSVVNVLAFGLLYLITFKVNIKNPLDYVHPITDPLNNLINNIINYGGEK
ncbi:MAG: hypothetical protein K0S51_1578 [Bacillales bacterium]|jgi:hypothetical protein|nr:hypothetical protein [Bacillales bacterium]